MSLLTKVTEFAIKTRVFVGDHEAAIELGAGIACFAVSVVAAAKASVKTQCIVEEYKFKKHSINVLKETGTDVTSTGEMVEYTEEDAKKDLRSAKLKTAGRLAVTWAPTVLGFAGGTGLVLRSHHVMVKTNLGLAAALEGANETLNSYRSRVANKIGDEEEKNLFDGKEEVTTTKKEKDKDGKTVKTVEKKVEQTNFPISQYGRILGRDYVERDSDWDCASNDYNFRKVKQVEEMANRRLKRVGKVFLNEIYDALGLPQSEDGDVVGWRLVKYGGKTEEGGIRISIIDNLLKADPNNKEYIKDDWTGDLVIAANPFFVDFNVEGCILGKSTLRKIGGVA